MSSSERTFSFSEVSMLVDTVYKANVMLEESFGDTLIEHLEHQNLLSLSHLETRPAKEVLKIFRGCLMPTTAAVSQGWRNKLFSLFEAYLDTL